jgi:hypothetical protein
MSLGETDDREISRSSVSGGNTVRYLRPALALALLALAAPLSASAAMHPNHVALHSPLHKMGFQHAMASARLRYTKADVFINFTANNLPAPHVLGKMDYVLWVTNGSTKENAGALKLHGMMAGLQTQTMMLKLQDLIVTAENSPTVAQPHGPVVLSGMVG